jgi:hypothetical protein
MKHCYIHFRICLLGWLLGSLLSAAVTAQDLHPGMTRAEVIEEMGYPSNRLSRGAVEVLQYDAGVKLTLRNGLLRSAEGIELTRKGLSAAAVETSDGSGEDAAESGEPAEEIPPVAEEEALDAGIDGVESERAAEAEPDDRAAPALPEFPDWESYEEPSEPAPVWFSLPVILVISTLVLYVSIQLGYNFASVSGQGSEIWKVAGAFAVISALIDLVPLPGDFAMILFWGIIGLKSLIMVILLRLLTYLRSALPILEIALVSMVAHSVVSIWITAFVVSVVSGLFF